MKRPPDSEHLFQRVRVLFGVVPNDLVPERPANSPYSTSGPVHSFKIGIPDKAMEPRDPAEAAAVWLNTPSPTFGGLCPKKFLEGTDDERAFFDGILSSLEDGAFS